MENNAQEFSMEKYNDFLKTIKSGSPVHKINFTLESSNAVVGMYLITMEDAESYINKRADYKDLNDNTLLVFESRHVVECCQIIYGCLNILKSINMYRMEYKVFIDQIIDTLLSKPLFYDNAIKELANLTYNCIVTDDSNKALEIYKRFLYIMKSVWFIPYGRIDQMAEEAIKEFKKHTEDNNNE